MKVELLVVEFCPNEVPARDALERTLVDLGLEVDVSTVVITDDATARDRNFVGSPSFYVDGRDLFPASNAAPGLACRVYPTPTGLRGMPDMRALHSALGSAVAATAERSPTE